MASYVRICSGGTLVGGRWTIEFLYMGIICLSSETEYIKPEMSQINSSQVYGLGHQRVLFKLHGRSSNREFRRSVVRFVKADSDFSFVQHL